MTLTVKVNRSLLHPSWEQVSASCHHINLFVRVWRLVERLLDLSVKYLATLLVRKAQNIFVGLYVLAVVTRPDHSGCVVSWLCMLYSVLAIITTGADTNTSMLCQPSATNQQFNFFEKQKNINIHIHCKQLSLFYMQCACVCVCASVCLRTCVHVRAVVWVHTDTLNGITAMTWWTLQSIYHST